MKEISEREGRKLILQPLNGIIKCGGNRGAYEAICGVSFLSAVHDIGEIL